MRWIRNQLVEVAADADEFVEEELGLGHGGLQICESPHAAGSGRNCGGVVFAVCVSVLRPSRSGGSRTVRGQ